MNLDYLSVLGGLCGVDPIEVATFGRNTIMRVILSLFVLTLILSPSLEAGEGEEARSAQRAEAQPQLETVATGLEVPWAIDFAPDGRIFVTERGGRIREIEEGRLNPKSWARLDVVQHGDGGLQGLAISPDFAQNGHVFVAGTFLTTEGQAVNRIYRLTDRQGRGRDLTLIVDQIPSPDVHRGGALAFGPDGMLYFTVGDVRRLDAVQDLKSPVGKILRYRPDGSIPSDNPFPNSPVYALGVRNPQGIDWHPETGTLFETEHGPSDFPGERGQQDQDELNAILPRKNYGWPLASGLDDDKRFITPLTIWTPAIAPAGLAVCDVKGSPWYGQIFVGGMRGQQLRRINVERASSTRTGWRVVEEEALFHNQLGRIRAVAMGPDGYLYFANSNRDSDGKEMGLFKTEDDRLFRLRIPSQSVSSH